MKKHRQIIFLSLLFFIIYGLVSFVNHFNYNTSALDLGMYNNAIYDYAHLRFSYSECLQSTPVNLFSADHFDLFLVLVFPFYWLFGTYTLLVIQVIVLVFGGIGIYCIANIISDDKTISLIFACIFWIFYGVFSALSYDYHGNVIAAGLLPWFIYFIYRDENKIALLFFILIIICKESMALWMFFVCTGYAWIYRSEKHRRNRLIILSFISLIYFILLIKLLMPALGETVLYAHIEYKTFGNNFNEIVTNIFIHPITAIKYLFVEHCADATSQWTKVEFHFFIFLSGGVLFFFRPVYLWMMIPVLVTKMYHDRWGVHGVGGQYSIEFAPVLVLCAIDFLNGKKDPFRKKVAFVLLLLSIAVTVRSFDKTISWTKKSNVRFYKSDHYKSDFNRASVEDAMKLIPDNAIISVQTNFHPHLAYRDKAYQFPFNNGDAEYFLFSNKFDIYPLTKQNLDSIKTVFETDSAFVSIYRKDDIYLFRKRKK